jgi:hypothetical protein
MKKLKNNNDKDVGGNIISAKKLHGKAKGTSNPIIQTTSEKLKKKGISAADKEIAMSLNPHLKQTLTSRHKNKGCIDVETIPKLSNYVSKTRKPREELDGKRVLRNKPAQTQSQRIISNSSKVTPRKKKN